MFSVVPITLSTDKIELRPMSLKHSEAFYHAGNHAQLWRWVQPNFCQTLETSRNWLTTSLAKQEVGEHVPFVIFDKASQQLIGSTRYCSIRAEDRGIEIGFTFVTPQFQRTYVNSHAKYCLLNHAFETLAAIRVEFKTHEKNDKSRNAILRLGATFEGIARNQRVLADGSFRNTAIFSITYEDWPTVKANLLQKMRAY